MAPQQNNAGSNPTEAPIRPSIELPQIVDYAPIDELHRQAIATGKYREVAGEKPLVRVMKIIAAIVASHEGVWKFIQTLSWFFKQAAKAIGERNDWEKLLTILWNNAAPCSDARDEGDVVVHAQYLLGIAEEALDSWDAQLAVSIVRYNCMTRSDCGRLGTRLTGLHLTPRTEQLALPADILVIVDSRYYKDQIAVLKNELEILAFAHQDSPPSELKVLLSRISPGVLSGVSNHQCRTINLNIYKRNLGALFMKWNTDELALQEQVLYLQDIERAWQHRIADRFHQSVFLPSPFPPRNMPLHRYLISTDALAFVQAELAKRQDKIQLLAEIRAAHPVIGNTESVDLTMDED